MKNFKEIFKKINNLSNFKLKSYDNPIIDIERCRLYYSAKEASRDLGVAVQNIYKAINCAQRIKGCRLEFFDEWKDWDSRAKEKYSAQFNIYFM